MSKMTDEFETYSWETDEGWISIERRLDFSAVNDRKKKKILKKRRLKYYKEQVNPEYEPGAAASKPEKTEQTKSDSATDQKQSESADDKKANESNEEFSNGDFVKFSLNNPKYTGLYGEVKDFLPTTKRYRVEVLVPECQGYKAAINVKSSNISKASKIPVYAEMIMHVSVAVLAFLSVAMGSLRIYSLLLAAFVHLASLFYLVGKPKWSPEYAQNALQNAQSMNALCAMSIMSISRAWFFLAPVVCRSLVRGVSQLVKLTPSLANTLKRVVDPIMERVPLIEKFALTCEVYIGFGLFPGYFVGMSSFGGIFMFWNYLRMKYIFSPQLKTEFNVLKRSIDGKLYGYPTILGYWHKACNYAYSYVNVAQMQQQYTQSSQGGGMMSNLASKCNIM